MGFRDFLDKAADKWHDVFPQKVGGKKLPKGVRKMRENGMFDNSIIINTDKVPPGSTINLDGFNFSDLTTKGMVRIIGNQKDVSISMKNCEISNILGMYAGGGVNLDCSGSEIDHISFKPGTWPDKIGGPKDIGNVILDNAKISEYVEFSQMTHCPVDKIGRISANGMKMGNTNGKKDGGSFWMNFDGHQPSMDSISLQNTEMHRVSLRGIKTENGFDADGMKTNIMEISDVDFNPKAARSFDKDHRSASPNGHDTANHTPGLSISEPMYLSDGRNSVNFKNAKIGSDIDTLAQDVVLDNVRGLSERAKKDLSDAVDRGTMHHQALFENKEFDAKAQRKKDLEKARESSRKAKDAKKNTENKYAFRQDFAKKILGGRT